MTARSQPNSRAALTTILSNTGCVSVGAWLMVRNISAVAACCRRASASSASRSASAAAKSWRGGLIAFFAADDALRVRDIALALPTRLVGGRLFDLQAKGKVRLQRQS